MTTPNMNASRRINLFVFGLAFLVIMMVSLFSGLNTVQASETPGYGQSDVPNYGSTASGTSYVSITPPSGMGNTFQAAIHYTIRNSGAGTATDSYSYYVTNGNGYFWATGSGGQTESDGAEHDSTVINIDGEMWDANERQYMMYPTFHVQTYTGYILNRATVTAAQSNFHWGTRYQNTDTSTSGQVTIDMSTNGCGITGYNFAYGSWYHADTYSVWYTPITYYVHYNANGGTGSMADSTHTYGVYKNLSANAFSKYYTVSLNANGGYVNPTSVKASAEFLGWAETTTGSVKFSNMQSVKDLKTNQGDVKQLYAKWGNATVGSLPTPTRTGYTFLGWYTSASGGTRYYGGETISADMTLYAHWEPIKYWVQFNPNSTHGVGSDGTSTVTGTMPTIQLTYDQLTYLPLNTYYKTTKSNRETQYGPDVTKTSSFKGWSLSPTALTQTYTNGQGVMNLTSTANAVITFYAIWDDSPYFIITDYPNRYFTVGEAQSGMITAANLLSTVIAYDRETYPLAKGSLPGITIPTYNSSIFTSVTGSATIPVQYYLRDSWGHEAWLNINVYITPDGANDEDTVEYIRGLSSKYYRTDDGSFQDVDLGGLDPRSIWLNNDYYTNALDSVLVDESTPMAEYEFSAEEMENIRSNVISNGFGTSNLDNQLASGQFNTE